MSSSEADRKNILKQMKVRTTYKKDKSWIHQENSEDERDDSPSPLSPQLKALEGRSVHWSPTSDSNSERNSGTFRAKEVLISSSPPASSSNKQFSYSSNETNKSTSTTSQPSTQPPTASYRMPSYIIRGQPVNSVSQARGSPSSNGYKNSYSSAQPRTSNSLPRVPNATGHRMSTEEYKKLAPYNVKNRSSDVSDDETLYTPREQDIRTEQASSVLRNTSSRDRSYVLSAAKRNSGTGVQETSEPFVAKRVQIEEEETNPKKSETLPKTLSSYLYEDNKRFENHWKEIQASQATSPSATSRVETNSSSGPKLTSYSTSNTVENQSSARRPEPGKITVVTEESNNNENDKPRATAESELPAHTVTARKESNNNENDKPRATAESELPAHTVTARKERVETKKCDLLPDILAAYLYDDINSFEKGWKPNISTESTSQTVVTRETGHSESPKLTSWSTNTESKTVKPEPGRITILRDEREDTNKESSKPSVESRYTTRTENTDVPDSLKLPSSSLSTSVSERTQPRVQAGPGKLSHIRDERDVDNSKVSNRSSTTTTTTHTRITTETRIESRSPRPAPRMETKPKEAAVLSTSDNQKDLISWTDLNDNANTRIAKETPTPVPRQNNKDSEKSTGELPTTIVSPELNSARTNQPTKPAAIIEVEKTGTSETRYRVSESLNDSDTDDYDYIYNQISFGNRRVTDTSSDTQSKRTCTPELRSSSPRPTPRPRESINTTVIDSEYRVPETREDTMLEAGPSRSSSRTSVTTTRSTVPSYRGYMDDSDNRSVRSVSSSRSNYSTTTMDTQYENPLAYEDSEYDAQSSSSKGVLFVKEYVNSRESMKSPTTTGSISEFSDDLESIPFSSNSSYLYSSATSRSDEGPCTYCGREIKDCPKIMLEHLNIYCHEYCFKCGICHKPMGDLTDSLFIHRDVVHCEGCYEKLF